MIAMSLWLAGIAAADPPGRDIEGYREKLSLRRLDCRDDFVLAKDVGMPTSEAMSVFHWFDLPNEDRPIPECFADYGYVDMTLPDEPYIPAGSPISCDDSEYESDFWGLFDNERLDRIAKSVPSRLRVTKFDTNGDGVQEAFFMAGWLCSQGVSQCSILGFENGNLANPPFIQGTGHCVLPGPASSRGRSDITIVGVESSRMVGYRTYRFEGSTYAYLRYATFGAYLQGD